MKLLYFTLGFFAGLFFLEAIGILINAAFLLTHPNL